jgi:hypothetical protein
MSGILRNKEHIRHLIDNLTIGQMRAVLHEINDNDLSMQTALSFVIYGNYTSFNRLMN